MGALFDLLLNFLATRFAVLKQLLTELEVGQAKGLLYFGEFYLFEKTFGFSQCFQFLNSSVRNLFSKPFEPLYDYHTWPLLWPD